MCRQPTNGYLLLRLLCIRGLEIVQLINRQDPVPGIRGIRDLAQRKTLGTCFNWMDKAVEGRVLGLGYHQHTIRSEIVRTFFLQYLLTFDVFRLMVKNRQHPAFCLSTESAFPFCILCQYDPYYIIHNDPVTINSRAKIMLGPVENKQGGDQEVKLGG